MSGEGAIRVGSLVRIRAYPFELTDIAGRPVIDPTDLFDRTWRVTSRSYRGWYVSFEGAGFVNRAGQPVGGGNFSNSELEVVGFAAPDICDHLRPVLFAMEKEGAAVVEDTYCGHITRDPTTFICDRNTYHQLAMDRRPAQHASPLILATPDHVRYFDYNGRRSGCGVFCLLCRSMLTWPYDRRECRFFAAKADRSPF